MLYSKKDPIEGDDDGDELGDGSAGGGGAPNDNDGDETVTEHRIITRHARTGKILSNVKHTGFHGQPQPPRGGSLHPDGSMIQASGNGPGMGSRMNGKLTDGALMPRAKSVPSAGSSKPGAMGPKKDGRAKISAIVSKFRKI
jgi:hypothetical protein